MFPEQAAVLRAMLGGGTSGRSSQVVSHSGLTNVFDIGLGVGASWLSWTCVRWQWAVRSGLLPGSVSHFGCSLDVSCTPDVGCTSDGLGCT